MSTVFHQTVTQAEDIVWSRLAREIDKHGFRTCDSSISLNLASEIMRCAPMAPITFIRNNVRDAIIMQCRLGMPK
jgi:hypothetical protein